MPLARALARKASTHSGKRCAAVCAKAGPPSASEATPESAADNISRRAIRIGPAMRPNRDRGVASILPRGRPICYLRCNEPAQEPSQEEIMSDFSVARRGVIAGAGAGLVAGLVSE